MKKAIYYTVILLIVSTLFFQCKKDKSNPNEEEVLTGDWVPPIGIPRPSFGIEETYRMYDDSTNRNPELTYTENAEGGFYTHYIDFAIGTDTDNPYGTKSNPRKIIPDDLPEGSVVEINGLYNDPGFGNYFIITGVGSSAKPIFIRGLKQNEKAVINKKLVVEGQYLIFENIIAYGGRISFSNAGITDHVSIRYCEIKNSPGASSILISGAEINPVNNIVIYKNEIHNADQEWDQGNDDTDACGVIINSFSNNIWIVDNHIYHCKGSGIATGQYGNNLNDCNHIYYGKNVCHDNRQTSIGCKIANHVIISQNVSYNHFTSQIQTGNVGAGIGFQYGPENVWILYNEIYNSEAGIKVGSSSGGHGDKHYLIGNLIYNINSECNAFECGAAIAHRGSANLCVINNTIYKAKQGIKYGSQNKDLYVSSNMVCEISGTHHFYAAGNNNLTLDNNLFYNSSGSAILDFGNTDGDVEIFEQERPNLAHNNLETAPLFTNISQNDYSLQETSPGIDAGFEDDVYQLFENLYGIDIRYDITGKKRPENSTEWDIGAYEYKQD